MTNGSHEHTCVICGTVFRCRILVQCFVEDQYAVCDRQACITAWEAPKREGDEDAEA